MGGAHRIIFGTQQSQQQQMMMTRGLEKKRRSRRWTIPIPTSVVVVVICILICSIKTVAVAGNAIRNIDHRLIINDTSTTSISSDSIDDSSANVPQKPHGHIPQPTTTVAVTVSPTEVGDPFRKLNHSPGTPDRAAAVDAAAAAAVAGRTGQLSTSSSSSSSILGRAATYSYYYIGRKLIYVPLFFLLYWTVYNMWLLCQAIASRWVRVGSTTINIYVFY